VAFGDLDKRINDTVGGSAVVCMFVPSQIHAEIQLLVLRGGTFKRRFGHEGSALTNRLMTLLLMWFLIKEQV
jgi:hypothetical protein